MISKVFWGDKETFSSFRAQRYKFILNFATDLYIKQC